MDKRTKFIKDFEKYNPGWGEEMARWVSESEASRESRSCTGYFRIEPADGTMEAAIYKAGKVVGEYIWKMPKESSL